MIFLLLSLSSSTSCLILKTIIKIIYRSHIIVKLTSKSNILEQQIFLNEINCKQPLISNTLYGRRHSKLFTIKNFIKNYLISRGEWS